MTALTDFQKFQVTSQKSRMEAETGLTVTFSTNGGSGRILLYFTTGVLDMGVLGLVCRYGLWTYERGEGFIMDRMNLRRTIISCINSPFNYLDEWEFSGNVLCSSSEENYGLFRPNHKRYKKGDYKITLESVENPEKYEHFYRQDLLKLLETGVITAHLPKS